MYTVLYLVFVASRYWPCLSTRTASLSKACPGFKVKTLSYPAAAPLFLTKMSLISYSKKKTTVYLEPGKAITVCGAWLLWPPQCPCKIKVNRLSTCSCWIQPWEKVEEYPLFLGLGGVLPSIPWSFRVATQGFDFSSSVPKESFLRKMVFPHQLIYI